MTESQQETEVCHDRFGSYLGTDSRDTTGKRSSGRNTDLSQQILTIVKSPIFGNQAIMNVINGLQDTAATGESVDSLQDGVDELSDKVDDLSENIGAFQIVRTGQYHRI
jgi:hypothetical protein